MANSCLEIALNSVKQSKTHIEISYPIKHISCLDNLCTICLKNNSLTSKSKGSSPSTPSFLRQRGWLDLRVTAFGASSWIIWHFPRKFFHSTLQQVIWSLVWLLTLPKIFNEETLSFDNPVENYCHDNPWKTPATRKIWAPQCPTNADY